jgi:hypothetical protein
VSFERPAIKYSRGYTIIINPIGGIGESKREDFRTLDEAQRRFEFHKLYLKISLGHKVRMGIPKEVDEVLLTLWDKSEGFELAETTVFV